MQRHPRHVKVDTNCSKMWVQGHKEILSVSWTSSDPPSHTALMTMYSWEGERVGPSHSVREEPVTLCSAPFLCQGVTISSWNWKEKKLDKRPQLHEDSGPPVRHHSFQRNLLSATISNLPCNEFTSASPRLSLCSKGEEK